MSQHEGLIQNLLDNEKEGGQAVMMACSEKRAYFAGTIDGGDLLDFLETMFRMQPGIVSIFQEAIDQSEIPTS